MITYHRDEEGFVTLTLDMPDRAQNVWNQDSLDALNDVIAQLRDDDDARGALFVSGKTDFLAGGDLDDLQAIAFGDRNATELYGRVGALSEALRALETLGKPVVACIHGNALGGGYELALACHYRLAAPNAKVGLPESTLGLLPAGGGTQRLPRMIGVQAALPILMEGKQYRAEDALRNGLVDQVVPQERLIDEAKAWLRAGGTAAQPWDQRGFAVPGGGMEDAKTLSTFMVANALFMAKTHGNYPAGRAILSCVFEGLRLPIDQGLLIEKRYMVQLLLDPVAGNMIRTLFLSLQRANKLVRRPEGIARRRPKRVGVLGAGLMGAGIAYACARAGIDAVVVDLSEERAAGAHTYVTEKMARAIKKGWKTAADQQAILARIHPTTAYGDLSECDVIIEAVFEDRTVKATVTRAAAAEVGDRAVIASNTSTLPITGLATASPHPERFIGLHFFSPAEKMPLVEVIRGEQTDDTTLAWALDFVAALGKTPIVVNDARGFYTSRVFGTYITEGMAMLREGIAPSLIENAGRQSGMPMPPLALADEVGLALMVQVGEQTRADLGEAAPENPSTPVLEALVHGHDRAGKRSGRGFYDYGEQKKLWSGLAEAFPLADTQPTVAALVERFLFTQALEAARCMEQGVLLAAEDADVGAILGWGFAPYTGGPLSYIDQQGAAAFLARAEVLCAAHGERFAPPSLLREMAERGETFYP